MEIQTINWEEHYLSFGVKQIKSTKKHNKKTALFSQAGLHGCNFRMTTVHELWGENFTANVSEIPLPG